MTRKPHQSGTLMLKGEPDLVEHANQIVLFAHDAADNILLSELLGDVQLHVLLNLHHIMAWLMFGSNSIKPGLAQIKAMPLAMLVLILPCRRDRCQFCCSLSSRPFT